MVQALKNNITRENQMKHSKYFCLRHIYSFLLVMLFLFAGLATTTERGERASEEIRKKVEETQKYVQQVKEENEKKLQEEQNKSDHYHEEQAD